MIRYHKTLAQCLLEVNVLLMRSIAADMREGPHGIGPMHVVLLTKLEAGEASLSELAKHQSVSVASMSKTIKLLMERGWIQRRTPNENRRQIMVRLTPSGQRAFAAAKKRAVSHVAGLLAPMPRTQSKQIIESLSYLHKTLAAAPTPGGG